MNQAQKWIQNHKNEILNIVKDFLEIPSISSDPRFKSNVLEAAEWVQKNFVRLGLETRLLETEGYPVIFAQTKINPEKKTVLCYFHYDVQPAGDENLWKFGAFHPTEEENRLYGRGTTDDKMQGLIHTFALEAMLNSSEDLPVNFKFCIEGEEEISSPHVVRVLEENKELFNHDYMIISDGYMSNPNQPMIEVGARGIVYTQIKVTTGGKDLHSGQWGGIVRNANFELIKLISRLKDVNGKVTIPHFYEDIIDPTLNEQENWKALSITKKDYIDASEVFALDTGEKGYSLIERNWSRPTLEVNGIWGGHTGEGTKTVIPCEAHAKVSMRLVPGQNPKKILELYKHYLESLVPEGVVVEVEWSEMAPAFLALPNDPIFDKARLACEKAYGTKGVLTRTGGTIGMLTGVKEIFNKPILLMNFGTSDENAHAPNEFMRLSNFWRGIETSLNLWYSL